MSVVAWVRHLPDLLVDMAQRLDCAVARLQRRLGSRQVEVAALEAVPEADSRLADKQDKRLWLAAYGEDVADSQRRSFSAAPSLRHRGLADGSLPLLPKRQARPAAQPPRW